MLRPCHATLSAAAAALLLAGSLSVFAQTPATPPAAPAAPPAQENPVPPATPPAAEPPAPPPAANTAPPVQTGDPFGEEIVLTEKTIVFLKGTATWDNAFETLVDAYKTLYTYIDKQGLKADGPAMTIYTSTDDSGFQFNASVPIVEAPKNPPQGDLAIGKSPAGKALKFVHRGSYDSMDATYETITNYLDERKLDAKDMFIEEYVTDLLKTPSDQLVVNVLVPLK